jgi:hypothetical protein
MGHVELSQDQTEAAARSLHRDVQELVFEDWPASEPGLILRENVRRLLGNPGAMSKGALAELLGVSPATLSRWIGGQQVPDTRAREAIASMFGLRTGDDLERTPIFLSFLPVTHAERLAWLHDRLGDVTWDELRDLFPALHRLLAGPTTAASAPRPSPRGRSGR